MIELIAVCATIVISVVSGSIAWAKQGKKPTEEFNALIKRVERLELQREEFVRLEGKVDSIQDNLSDLKTELKELGRKLK